MRLTSEEGDSPCWLMNFIRYTSEEAIGSAAATNGARKETVLLAATA